MSRRSSIITIFSHFPCCFYFCFLRVIISEHHRIKTHNFCSGFCPRFCCSLAWPGWQSLNSQEKKITSKMVQSLIFLQKIQIYYKSLLSCVHEGVSSTEGREPEIVLTLLIWAQRPVEALASQQTNTETTFKLTPDREKIERKIIINCGDKVCRTIFVQNLNYVIEYLPNTGVIRENWNIIYWFIEIRWISFSEFCIFSQLFCSQ